MTGKELCSVCVCVLSEQVSGNTHHFLAHIFCPMSIAQFQMGCVTDVLKVNGATMRRGFPALS